jgi:hypothetical protein
MNSINKILMESVVDMLSHFLLKFPLIVNKEIPGLQLLHQATHVLDDVGSNSVILFKYPIVAYLILMSRTHHIEQVEKQKL